MDADNAQTHLSSWILVLLFYASLQMLSLDVLGSGTSANYLYLLIPLVVGLPGLNRRIIRREQLLLVLSVYTLIFLLGVPGDLFGPSGGPYSALRRLFSYWVFLFPLLLSFVEFRTEDIGLFKKAIVLASIYYSLKTISAVALLAGSVGVNDLKTVVGSQRYGFILALGFFIALLSDTLLLKKRIYLQRLLICSVILAGMVLTFSRATLVALAGGLVFLSGRGLYDKFLRGSGKSAPRIPARKVKRVHVFSILVLAFVLYGVFQRVSGVDLWSFYGARFIEPLFDSTLLNDALAADLASSEGYRYYILVRVGGYLAAHPIIGSSYRGIYLLFDEFKDGGATHNQYTDVFLRTGLLGGLLWLYLLYRSVRFCGSDRGLSAGLVSILIYGLFHETFKLPHGSFVFGMLLSFSYLRRSSGVPSRRETSSGPARLTERSPGSLVTVEQNLV